MFTNFIYFLTALILYTTCYYPEGAYYSPENTFFYVFICILLFLVICRLLFIKLVKNNFQDKILLENKINFYITKLSILALIIYCIDLYYFRLKLFFLDYKIFQLFPTLLAVIFLLLFLLYFIIIWDSAWIVKKRFFPRSVKRKDFIISNISFSLPALIPWFLLSIIADIIQLLPYKNLSHFLSTPLGEALYIFISLIAMAVFGPFLIQKLWRCKPLEDEKIREQIKNLAIKTDFKYSDILKWDLFGGSMITAGIMGIWSKLRYLLVTPALINLLNEKEIDSVIAHEIGHAKKNHLYFYVLFFAVYMACVYFLFDPLMLLINSSSSIYKFALFLNINSDTLNSIILSLVLVILLLLCFRYIFGFFMRNFERQADAYIFSVMDDSEGLITTFNKIVYYSGQSPDKPSWHHFSIAERIKFLFECEADKTKIYQHEKKIIKMIAYFIFSSVIIFVSGYSLNYGKASKYLNNYVAQKVLEQEFSVNQDNRKLYTIVGDYNYGIKEFKNAEIAWQNTLKIDPDDLHALNNLAWLYATCEDENFRNKIKAYELASKAIKIQRAPFVLDTYAEACLLNGYCKKALDASIEAFKGSDMKKRRYYKNQYQRIKLECIN